MSRPLTSWLALAVFVFALAAIPDGSAQRRHGPSPLDTLGGEPDQELGWKYMQAFRSWGIYSDYAIQFDLKVMPRREKTRSFSGTLLGTRGDGGPVSRIDIALEAASIGDSGELVPAKVDRMLLENGLFAKGFELPSNSKDGEPKLIPSDRYFEPIAGSDFTVFDLLTPYVYWQKFYYEGRTKHRSRPVHVIWLYPPEDDELMRTKVSGVRVFLDEEFSGPIQVEIYDANKEHAKTVTPVGLKKVDGQYIMNQIDVRNEMTRDKTRMKVVEASLNVDLPDYVFTLQGLTETVYGNALPEHASASSD